MRDLWIIGSLVMGSFLLLAGILTGISRAMRYVLGSISSAWNLRPLTLNPPMSILKGLVLNGIVSGGVAWYIAHRVAWNSTGMTAALIGGMGMGIISGVITETKCWSDRQKRTFERWTAAVESVHIFSGFLNGWLGGIACGAAGESWGEALNGNSNFFAAAGGSMIIAVFILNFAVFPILSAFEALLSWTVFRLLTPALILRRFAAIVCQHCLRLTQPLRSGYAEGIRYCEHCASPVDLTNMEGSVRVIFGEFLEFSAAAPVVMPETQNTSSASPKRRPAKPFPRKQEMPLSPITMRSLRPPQQILAHNVSPQIFWFQAILRRLPDRVFLLINPDFDQPEVWSLEIEEVYIDPATCERYLLERFLTYILNYPPSKGLASVRILHHGELQQFGENLKNAFVNNFQIIEPLA